MGRGRAKAKQTKVARALKYSGPETDFERLQRELANSQADVDTTDESESSDDEEDDEEDPYAKYYDDEDDEDTAQPA